MRNDLEHYFAPTGLAEALELGAEFAQVPAAWLAGGTDLKPAGNSQYKVLIDLKNIAELLAAGVLPGGGVTLGALTTVQSLYNGQGPAPPPILRKAARVFGSQQIRNRATIGGNICTGSPAADMAAALLASDAVLHWQGPGGSKVEALRDFYALDAEARCDRVKTAILVRVEIPGEMISPFCGYGKLGERGALEIGLVKVAAVLQAAGGRITRARVVLGSVAATPVRAVNCEEYLTGKGVDDLEAFKTAGRIAANECRPASDFRASAAYRRAMVNELAARTILGAAEGEKNAEN